MTSKIFCVLSNDPNLTAFPVNIDLSLTISDLKDVIGVKKSPRLDYLAADELTLVRICKANPLSLATYGEDPEDGGDGISAFQFAPGACLVRK
ncbi:hypothetical protein HK100_005883, partial [Physocladia obscura]